MSVPSLGDLPDEILLHIIEQLPLARDLAHVSAASTWAHRVVQERGWRDFVEAKFPSLRHHTPSSMTAWGSRARDLAYLDRCWNKRGFFFLQYSDLSTHFPGFTTQRQRRPRGGQSVTFQTVVAAAMADAEDELVVCGAGEDLQLIRRPAWGAKNEDLTLVEGSPMGYRPGVGDVTALTVLAQRAGGQEPEIVVGRANGDLQLLSAGMGTLGTSTQRLFTGEQAAAGLRSSPGQTAISWTEWEAMNEMLASCRGSSLMMHRLSDREEALLQPTMQFDFAEINPSDEVSLVKSVKFMSPDAVACALGGCRQPLRLARIRPEELVFDGVQGWRKGGEKTTVRAIESVPALNPKVILSAWDDGGHRLFDTRTPSLHDALYRDPFKPYEPSSSILVYGSERFVTGLHSEPGIRLFDFRFPRPYQHFDALPCSVLPPTPVPPGKMSELKLDDDDDEDDDNGNGNHKNNGKASEPRTPRCDPASGRRCPWHRLSAEPSWQPDATINLGFSSFDRVCSLAKSADTTPSFYIGVRGSMVETVLRLAEDSWDLRDPGIRRGPIGTWAQWYGQELRGISPQTALIESGIGLCAGGGDNDNDNEGDATTGLPSLYYWDTVTASKCEDGDPCRLPGSRLDRTFTRYNDRRFMRHDFNGGLPCT